MSSSSNVVIAAAREWLGTRYRHQSASKQVGVDCIQFVLAVGREVGACGDIPIAPYRMVNSPKRVVELLNTYGEPVDPQLGVVMFWGRRPGVPTHFGIRSELDGEIAVIHADAQLGKVVEHRIPNEQLPLIHSHWWFKPWQT